MTALAPIEVPIRVTGMAEYRRMLAEIRRGAEFFQNAGLGVTVNVYVGSFPEPQPRLDPAQVVEAVTRHERYRPQRGTHV